jgi:hypothetical protein
VSVPPLDDEARRRASQDAVRARRLRAEWKGRLGSGEVDLADLLAAAEDDGALAGMRVTDALGALPGVGPRGIERILASCGIAPSGGCGASVRTSAYRCWLVGPWGRQERA